MRDFYERYYQAVARSRAHAEFCERAFGRDMAQHGFADLEQVQRLIEATDLGRGQQALDVGCGNGMMAEYMSDVTGADFTGIDFVPLAISQARARTAAKASRLRFEVGDVNDLHLPAGAFDVVTAVDSVYFADDLVRLVGQLAAALRPRGCMGIFYSFGREPWVPVEEFPAEDLAPDRTPLARALQANGLPYETEDFTAHEHRLAARRKELLAELRPRFEEEEIMFLWENRNGESYGVSTAIEEGLHRRYLYVVS